MIRGAQFFLFLTLFFLVGFQSSFVEAKGGVDISPAFTEVTLTNKGEEKEIQLTLQNNTDQTITLELFPIDFKQQGEFGKIGFVGLNSQYSYSLASFLSLPKNEVELDPFSKETVEVQITNREDLSPGGHYAAVVARLKVENEEVSDEQAFIAPSVSSLILLKKTGGERYNLSYVRSSWPSQLVLFQIPKRFDMLLQNEGNVHLIPYGRIEIRDMQGRLLADGNINPSSNVILPESRRWVDGVITHLQKPSSFSINTLTVQGYDSLKKAQFLYKETFITVDPVPLVIIFAVIVGLSIPIWRGRRMKKK